MTNRYTLTLPVLATVAAALIAPALAEMPGGPQTAPDRARPKHGSRPHGARDDVPQHDVRRLRRHDAVDERRRRTAE